MAQETERMISGLGRQLPQMTLMAVVIAVLMPAAMYSIHLTNPTPSQLLVAICIGVFSSVVCLWILDAVDVLRFRNQTLANSIWAAAILSILGTGAGVFQGAFADRKYPYEGPWLIRVYSPGEQKFLAERQSVLIFSQSTQAYWGYSETLLPQPTMPKMVVSTEVVLFDPKELRVSLRMLFSDGSQTVLEQAIKEVQNGIRFQSTETDPTISLSRAR